MHLLRLDAERAAALKIAAGLAASAIISAALVSVFERTCDPRQNAGTAPYVGSLSIYGVPLQIPFVSIGVILLYCSLSQLPVVGTFVVKNRVAVIIGATIAAVLAASLPYPHRVLGACVS